MDTGFILDHPTNDNLRLKVLFDMEGLGSNLTLGTVRHSPWAFEFQLVETPGLSYDAQIEEYSRDPSSIPPPRIQPQGVVEDTMIASDGDARIATESTLARGSRKLKRAIFGRVDQSPKR